MSSFNGSRRQCVIPPIVYSTLQQLGRLSQDGFLGTLVDVLGLNYIWLRKLSILHLQVLVSSNSLCFLFFKSDKLIDKPPLGESRKKVTIHKLDGIAWSFLTVTWPLLQLLGHSLWTGHGLLIWQMGDGPWLSNTWLSQVFFIRPCIFSLT